MSHGNMKHRKHRLDKNRIHKLGRERFSFFLNQINTILKLKIRSAENLLYSDVCLLLTNSFNYLNILITGFSKLIQAHKMDDEFQNSKILCFKNKYFRAVAPLPIS